MRSLLKNNIFTNPAGWADKCIGTTVRYRLMQIYTVSFGAILIGRFWISSGPDDQKITMTILILLSVVEFPLMYLRALKHLHSRIEQTNN